MSRSVGTHVLNLARGALIGTAEAVPGISGGTVALITGVYESLITSAGHVLSGVRLLVTDVPRGQGTARARAELGRAHWGVIIAVLVGMVIALLVAARFLVPLVEHEQQYAFALFSGLVLASLWVPYSLSGGRWTWEYLVAVPVAAIAVVVFSLPAAQVTEPSPLVIMAVAAVAVCALVLPGASGSLFLLIFGLYTATFHAIDTRDFGYLGIFAVGAVIGLATLVKLLQWLLEHHRKITLVVMTGLLAGSLRALWPWQDEERNLLPLTDIPLTIGFAVTGFVVVTAAIVAERVIRGRTARPEEPART